MVISGKPDVFHGGWLLSEYAKCGRSHRSFSGLATEAI
jgi:hypothetical protein